MATVFSSPNVVKCLQVSPFYLVRSGMEREQCRSPRLGTGIIWAKFLKPFSLCMSPAVVGRKNTFMPAASIEFAIIDVNQWCVDETCSGAEYQHWSLKIHWMAMAPWRRALISIAEDSQHTSFPSETYLWHMQILGFPPLVLISDPSPAAIAGHPPSPLLCNWKCPWTPLPYRNCNNAGDKRLCISHPTMSDPMTVIRSG